LLDSRVLCALTITVESASLGSAATLWSSVAPSLRALVTWGMSYLFVSMVPCLKVCGSYSLSLFVSRLPSHMLLQACLALFVLSRS
ncbi:hypothetical protein C8Q74DRAFT_1225414, partial [Fomes fomentarius]